MDGIGVSPQPVKSLGAFDAPVASAPVGSNAAGKTVPTKPVTTGLVLDADKGAVTQSSKPIAIPDVAWTQPKTVVQAKNQVPGEKAVITYVPDGDTAYYKDKGGNQVRCRIDTFDAPEVAKTKHRKKGQDYGEEAKSTLQRMILNKEVTVRISRPAEEGKNFTRSTCQIEIEGANIDKKMLQEGAAWVYKTYRDNPELMAAEKEARESKRGLWANPNAQDPAAFRRMERYGGNAPRQ